MIDEKKACIRCDACGVEWDAQVHFQVGDKDFCSTDCLSKREGEAFEKDKGRTVFLDD